MKAYTDLPQSKVLSQILSLESADMTCIGTEFVPYPYFESKFKGEDNVYPAWSLAALLDILPKGTSISTPNLINELSYCCWNHYHEIHADNPVDACYEMIVRLNELNLL